LCQKGQLLKIYYFLDSLRTMVIANCLSDLVARSRKFLRRSFSSDEVYGGVGSAAKCGCSDSKKDVTDSVNAFAIRCMFSTLSMLPPFSYLCIC